MSNQLTLLKIIKQANKDLNIIYHHLDGINQISDEHIYNTLLNYYDGIEEKYKYHKDFLESREKVLKEPVKNSRYYLAIPIIALLISFVLAQLFLNIDVSALIAVFMGAIFYLFVKIFKKPIFSEKIAKIKEIEMQIISELKLHMDNVDVL